MFLNGKRDILTHSINFLLILCSEFNKDFLDLKSDAKRLDTQYLTSRYPDSLPDQTPVEFFEKEDAEESIKSAEKIVNKVLIECEKILKN